MATVISLATEDDHQVWDDYVVSQKNSGPYSLFAWKNAIEEAYGHKIYYLIARNDRSEVQGILPLVMVKPPFVKGVLVSQPFCDYGGILSENETISKALIHYAIDLASELQVKIEVRSKNQDDVLDDCLMRIPSFHKTRMVLELPDSSEKLLDSFKSKLRSQIKKPFKEGLTFRWGNIDTINDFYHVFSINMRDLGSPVHSCGFITSIIHHFGDRVRMGAVYKDGKAIGAGIILLCADTVSIPWASTLREFNMLSPNMMLYWSFLEYAADNGFRHFDFGRSTPDEGTFKFKEQWGACPSPLYWYNAGSQKHIDDGMVTGTLRGKIEKFWSGMPLPIANMVGPRIRKYITL